MNALFDLAMIMNITLYPNLIVVLLIFIVLVLCSKPCNTMILHKLDKIFLYSFHLVTLSLLGTIKCFDRGLREVYATICALRFFNLFMCKKFSFMPILNSFIRNCIWLKWLCFNNANCISTNIRTSNSYSNGITVLSLFV